MPAPTDFETCPCGAGVAYANHCKQLHDEGFAGLTATAEDTMRSRYSAYVTQNADYLLATWHESTRPASIDFTDPVEWHGLTIEDVDGGTGLTSSGEVEFRARFRRGDAHLELHERSSFVREQGRWYYVDGTDPDQPR